MDQPQIDAAISAGKSKCSVDGCEKPVRHRSFCNGHYKRLLKYGSPTGLPKTNRMGLGHLMKNGYRRTMIDGVTQFDHIRVAEKALGKPLPKGAEVHHVDENRSHNVGTNLVICPDAAYHDLLHLRMKARAAGVPLDWRKCRFCKTFDAPDNLFIAASGVHHRACINTYYRNQRGNP